MCVVQYSTAVVSLYSVHCITVQYCTGVFRLCSAAEYSSIQTLLFSTVMKRVRNRLGPFRACFRPGDKGSVWKGAALHCAWLHCTVLACSALYYTALHCTALNFTTLNYTALHWAVLACTVLHCTALHCTTNTALNCTALIHAALYCTKLNFNIFFYLLSHIRLHCKILPVLYLLHSTFFSRLRALYH